MNYADAKGTGNMEAESRRFSKCTTFVIIQLPHATLDYYLRRLNAQASVKLLKRNFQKKLEIYVVRCYTEFKMNPIMKI